LQRIEGQPFVAPQAEAAAEPPDIPTEYVDRRWKRQMIWHWEG